LKELYILGLLAMVLTLFFGNWRLVIVGFVIGSVALLFMALSVVDIKWKAKRPAKLLYDHKDEQVNNWLEALAKKDHKV
jgi:membrane protein implicated in regulation of membrane protease activity